MNAQTPHTPTPWRVTSLNGWDAICEERYPDSIICNLVFNNPTNAAFICEAVNSHALLVEHNEQLRSLLSQMLDAAENADETGYVTDLGFIDLDKLYATARAALNPPPTK